MIRIRLYCGSIQSAQRRGGEVLRERLEHPAPRVVDAEDEAKIVGERHALRHDAHEALLREIPRDEVLGEE